MLHKSWNKYFFTESLFLHTGEYVCSLVFFSSNNYLSCYSFVGHSTLWFFFLPHLYIFFFKRSLTLIYNILLKIRRFTIEVKFQDLFSLGNSHEKKKDITRFYIRYRPPMYPDNNFRYSTFFWRQNIWNFHLRTLADGIWILIHFWNVFFLSILIIMWGSTGWLGEYVVRRQSSRK